MPERLLFEHFGRSRKGAWIEMSLLGGALSNSASLP